MLITASDVGILLAKCQYPPPFYPILTIILTFCSKAFNTGGVSAAFRHEDDIWPQRKCHLI